MSASHDTGHMSASPDSSGLLVLVISLSEVQIGIGTSHITSGTSNGYGTSNSSNSYGTTNSNSSGGTNTNTLKIAEKIKLLFHDNYSRLFGFQLHIKNITIRSKDMSKVWESKNNSISLLFSNNQLGQLQSGLLIQVNQVFAKVSKLLLDQINGKSIVNNANGNIDSITEKVTKKLQLIMSKSSIITTFIPSIVICSSQTNLSIPMENKSADYNQGNLSLEEASIVLKSSRKGKSLDLSANIRIDYCSLTVFPKESQICDVKSFTFWNEFHINEMIPEFPFYLPIKLEAESFLTMISPTLTLHDEFLLSIAIWLQKNKQNKANHSVFSFENALLDLLKIKARIHLIEYDANLTIIPLKQQDLDFLLKAKGKQLFLSLSSKSEHGNTLLHEFPKGVVTITIEHSQNFITASTVQSPLGLDSPTKYKGPAQLLSIPSSSLSVTFTSDFQLNGSVTVESILIDLAGIARDTLLYESILMKLLYNHAVLKSYDTPNGQNNEKSNSGNGYNENVVVSNNNDNNAASQETPTLSFVDVFKQKNIGLNLECHVNKFSITLSSMLHPFHSLTLIAKRIRGRMIKFDELFSQLDLDEVLLQIVPANFYVASCLDLKTVRVKQQDPTSPIRCVIQESNIHIDISKIYVLIKCMSFITHLHNIIVKNITPLFPTPPPVFEENNLKDLPRFSLCFPNLKIHVELPENTRGLGAFTNMTIHSQPSRVISGSFETFFACVLKDPTLPMSELAILKDVFLKCSLANGIDPMEWTLDSEFSKLIVPYDWPVSNIAENGVNLIRIVKSLLLECLEKEPSNYFESGKTFFIPSETPSFIIKSSETIIILQDNLFESKLGRNYKIGYVENMGRLNREKEFLKKAAAKYPFMTREEYFELKRCIYLNQKIPGKSEAQIFKAWELLQEHNSSVYIKKIQEVHDNPFPPLLICTFHGLQVIASVSATTLSLEETLHEIDENTPPDLIYEDLIARKIKLTLNGMEFRLRDYTNPLILLPSTEDTELVMQGLVMIADLAGNVECRRKVFVPLEFDEDVVLSTSRSVNPTKIYMKTETEIVTKSNFQISIGAPYDACMADIISVIDNFTKPSEDPSPSVGWWDKLRVIMHGTNTLKLSGGGSLCLLILGSASPYFDPLKHVGVEGMEWSITNGIEIVLGSKTADPSSVSMSVECGELKVAIIQSHIHSGNVNREICFSKLTGGVLLVLKSDFVTPAPHDKNSFISPWRKHHEIKILTNETYDATKPGISSDSYYGFRSQFFHISMDIQSPRNYYSSLAVPRNCFYFNSETLDGIEKIFMIYQSLLTSVPIRRGNLFNSNTVLNKPKLGRVIASVALKTSFSPLMLSFILDCEDGFESVGLRLCATQMTFEAVFRQYSVKLIAESLLERKPVTKWIRESNRISFTDIEGKVLSYCGPDSDLYIQHNPSDINADLGSWIFKEDSFEDLSCVSLLSCVWAPRLDIIALETSKQTPETEEFATKAIMVAQYDLYQRRLAEVEMKISLYKERKQESKSRGAVFFDDTDIIDFNAELDSLQSKKQILLHSMEQCKNIIDGEGFENGRSQQHRVFNSKYIVHNLKLLWNAPVRNIIFRMAEVESKNRFLRFCLSNAAAQVATELVEIMTNQQKKSSSRKKSIFYLKEKNNDGSMEDIVSSFLRDAIPGHPIIIPCETETHSSKRNTDDIPTATSASADFESDDENCVTDRSIENDVLVRFINPQVHFEIERGDGSQNGCIILSALRMQIKFLLVLDALSAGHDKDRQDCILKFRNIWSLEDSQFLVQSRESIIPGHYEKYAWLPLESQVDQNIPVEHFGRVIDHAKVVFLTDKPNPLYTQRNSSYSATENPTTFKVSCPVLRCTATSYEYVTFYDFFKNLLVYRDPASGERSERLKKMLLALEYSDDLEYYRLTVLTLQEKVKQTEFLLNYEKRGARRLEKTELMEVRRAWIEYRSDLFVLMESLQNLQNIEIKRKSLNISWQLFVKIDEFTWLLQLDDNSCLCRWSINTLYFGWVNNEDQSNVNTLEIDTTYVENLSQAPNVFRDVISPYNPDNRDINYDKQKMIRIYWREAPPVGGIQVVAHFEVNIEPLLIQFTFDFGKQLSRYIFPSLTTTNSRKEIEGRKDDKKLSGSVEKPVELDQIHQMQERANQIKSFIYIKVPGVQHCMSYRGSKEKNFEDLNMFAFYLPTLEYRNKTWTWLDFLLAIKKDALRAALANTGALVREKFFSKKPIIHLEPHENDKDSDTKSGSYIHDDRSSVTSGGSLKKAMSVIKKSVRKLTAGKNRSELAPRLPPRQASFYLSHDARPSSLSIGSSHDDTSSIPPDNIIEPLSGRSTPFPQEILTLSQKARLFFGNGFPYVTADDDDSESII